MTCPILGTLVQIYCDWYPKLIAVGSLVAQTPYWTAQGPSQAGSLFCARKGTCMKQKWHCVVSGKKQLTNRTLRSHNSPILTKYPVPILSQGQGINVLVPCEELCDCLLHPRMQCGTAASKLASWLGLGCLSLFVHREFII